MFFVCLYHFAFLLDFFGNLFGVLFFLFSRFLSKYAKCNIEIVFSFFLFSVYLLLFVIKFYFLFAFNLNRKRTLLFKPSFFWTKQNIVWCIRGDYVFLAVCLWLFSQCNFYFIIYIFFKLNNIVHVSFVPFFYLFVI